MTEQIATAQKTAAWLSFKKFPCWRQKRNPFSVPRYFLTLAPLTHSYSDGQCMRRTFSQEQWIVQKMGGRLAEMHTHLAVCIFSIFIKHTLNGSHPHYQGKLSYWQLIYVQPITHWAYQIACKLHGQKQDFPPLAAAKTYLWVSFRHKLSW